METLSYSMAAKPRRAAAAAPPAMVRPLPLLVLDEELVLEPDACASLYPKPVVVYATPLEVVV